MQTETQRPERRGRVLAVGKPPYRIKVAYTEYIANTYTHLYIRNRRAREGGQRGLRPISAGNTIAVGEIAVGKFETDQLAQTQIAHARDKVKENTLSVPLGMQRHVTVGSILKIIHQRETIGVVGIALVSLEMVQHRIWHLA